MRNRFVLMVIAVIPFALAACLSGPSRAASPEPDFIRPPLPVDFGIDGCYTGAAVDWKTVEDGHEGTITAADLDHYSAVAGKKPAFLLFYMAFSYSGKSYAFPKAFCNLARAHDAVPYVTWEPRDWNAADPRSKTRSLLGEILEGRWDTLLDSWIAAVREYGSPLLLRFGHEMNGDWYPWSGVYNGGGNRDRWTGSAQTDGPRTYIEAYRYVFRRFHRAGVRNVIWVWSPNFESAPAEDWNRFENYYPGKGCVDVVALDAYNWGTARAGSKWTSFEGIYGQFYAAAVRLCPDKPIMIGEFGCADKGGDRPQWFRGCFQALKEKYPRTKIFTYFHMDNRRSEGIDFRIDADANSALAVREALRDPYFIDQAIIK
jgi:mannan endo-1,4-beta-mannosidase